MAIQNSESRSRGTAARRAPPGATWQGAEKVDAFLRRRETVIPMIDVQEELIGTLLDRHPHPIARFLDLGSGDGAMSELVLARRPGAEAVLVDFSEPMLARRRRAPRRSRRTLEHRARRPLRASLARRAARRVPTAPPSRAWRSTTCPAERKRALFAELFAAARARRPVRQPRLRLVAGRSRACSTSRWSPTRCAPSVSARASTPPTARPRRSVASSSTTASATKTCPTPPRTRSRGLREAGFEQAEVHFKWAEAAVFGGSQAKRR